MTVGIDLASQAPKTAACALDWEARTARMVTVPGGLSDDELVRLMLDYAEAVIGIDAPFGWPLAFIDTLATYRDSGAWLALDHEEIRLRATEITVRSVTGQAPLSVATSDLAWPAMRCGRLLSRVARDRGPLDRSGADGIVEVYPAAALRRWGVIPVGSSVAAAAYKGDKPGRRQRREQMLERLVAALEEELELSAEFFDVCAASDDALDAFVSALVARAVQQGESDPIPTGMRWIAMREGWIHLPREGSLPRLRASSDR